MSSNDYRALEAKGRRNLTAGNYKHWAITLLVVIFCLLPTSSTFGYAYYSDTWMDDSDPANIRIIGTGVTSDSNNGYMGYYPGGYGAIYHSYWVGTTLTSPDGRTVTVNSYHSSSYTSAETSLPLTDGNNFDLGDYSVQTSHWTCCPFMAPNQFDGSQCQPTGSSSISITIGASISVLTKAAMSNTYTILAYCPVHCPVEQLITGNDQGQYILCVVPWVYAFGNYQCSLVSINYRTTGPIQCADVSGTVPIIGIPF